MGRRRELALIGAARAAQSALKDEREAFASCLDEIKCCLPSPPRGRCLTSRLGSTGGRTATANASPNAVPPSPNKTGAARASFASSSATPPSPPRSPRRSFGVAEAPRKSFGVVNSASPAAPPTAHAHTPPRASIGLAAGASGAADSAGSAGSPLEAAGASADASAAIERIRGVVEGHAATVAARLSSHSAGAASTAEQVSQSERRAEESRAALDVAVGERDELSRRLAESEAAALSIRAASEEAAHEAAEAHAEAHRLAASNEELKAELTDRSRQIQRLLHASRRNAASHYGTAAAAKAASGGGAAGGQGSGGGEEADPPSPDGADADTRLDAALAMEATSGGSDEGHEGDDVRGEGEAGSTQSTGSARSSVVLALTPAAAPVVSSAPGESAAVRTAAACAACAPNANRTAPSEQPARWGGPSLITFTPRSPMACAAACMPAATHAEREAAAAHVAAVEPLQPALVLTALDLEHAKEAARAEERSLLRERLVESATLTDAAYQAVLSLDGALGGGVLSPPEAYEELIRERVISAALQVKLDELASEQRRQLATERKACKAIISQRSHAVEAAYQMHLESARRKAKLLASQAQQQRSELASLKALNAQLLNEADPLLLNPSRLNWPRHPPTALPSAATKPPALTGYGITAHGTSIGYSAASPPPVAAAPAGGAESPGPTVPLATHRRPASASGSGSGTGTPPARVTAAATRPHSAFASTRAAETVGRVGQRDAEAVAGERPAPRATHQPHAASSKRQPVPLFDTIETVVIKRWTVGGGFNTAAAVAVQQQHTQRPKSAR